MIKIIIPILLLGLTPSAAASTPVATFRVAEFNVTGGYDGWDKRLPLVVDTMLQAKASVYILNEAHEEENEDRQILAELRRQSHSRWVLVRGDGGNHFILDGGKYLVIKKRTIRLPHDRRYSELNLQHRATAVRFWVWNTHLTATMLPDRPGEVADAIREEQGVVIAEQLKRLHRSVGGGDTNNGVAGLRDQIAAVGHADVRKRTSNVTNAQWDSHELHYGPNKMRGRWIDLLAAGSLTQVNSAGLTDSGDASDHNLIWTSVSVRRSA